MLDGPAGLAHSFFMRALGRLLIPAMAIALASGATAQTPPFSTDKTSAKELARMCVSRDAGLRELCLAYFQGLRVGLLMGRIVELKPNCLQNVPDADAMALDMIHSLADSPKLQNEPADIAVAVILVRKQGCRLYSNEERTRYRLVVTTSISVKTDNREALLVQHETHMLAGGASDCETMKKDFGKAIVRDLQPAIVNFWKPLLNVMADHMVVDSEVICRKG
ncbi:MAG: hypothetical protein KIT36_14030 [Alphaproteobacteria bacterium]|nr:hypothetical protein [Alphaproteobacteria bacterium]